MGSITAETVDGFARAAGLALSADEVQTLALAVARVREMLDRLEALPMTSAEPATQYRIL